MAFENGIIDLRSDTVTHPTKEMRAAMAEAVVGDDVYGEDPTVNELEKKSAELLGMEDALFTASGTMGNLIAVMTHCGRGDEAIMGRQGHTFLHEVGNMSAVGGVFAQIIPNQPDGTLQLTDIKDAIRSEDIHHPETKLLILENTQNNCGGVPLTKKYMRDVKNLLVNHEVALHMDGARIFNASEALEIDPAELVADADSIMFCLSKGLCAPVGSMLCGSKEFIKEARKIRKQLGGGMRQAGILAAAGLISIGPMIKRLNEDHDRAKKLADGIKNIEEVELNKGYPQSNMVFVKLREGLDKSVEEIITEMGNEGIRISDSGPGEFRFVTHYWIDDADIKKFIEVFSTVFTA